MITYTDTAISPQDVNLVRQSVGWKAHSENRYKEAIEHSAYCQMAFDQQRPVGIARLIGDGIYYMIVDVAVDPAYQKLGIGKKMISNILAYLSKQLESGQSCTVLINASYGMEGFYENLGFKKLDTGTGMQLHLSCG